MYGYTDSFVVGELLDHVVKGGKDRLTVLKSIVDEARDALHFGQNCVLLSVTQIQTEKLTSSAIFYISAF